MSYSWFLLLGAALVAVPLAAQAQTLTLGDALERADGAAYSNRIAAGTAAAQGAQELAALRGVLPSVRLEGGFARTTDPIGAFGIALRQRRIAPADFDPARLNHPGPTSNYTGAVVLEQPLLNPDAHLGRLAASHAGAASRASEAWTRSSTQVEVIRAFYGAVLASEMVTTLEAGAEAAHAHVRQAEAMVRNGLATRSDALLAAVKAGEVDAQLAEARGNARLARKQLAMLLGSPADTLASPPAHLPAAEAIRALQSWAWSGSVERRGDVTAAHEGLSAADADLNRARSLYLPRLNAVARYDWNSPDRMYGGDESWTVGVMLSWTPFAGGGQLAETRAARGREVAARAGAEAAVAQARLQVEQAENDWEVALERLRIAEEAVAQSAEAHRIVTRKYEGGLATVLELLGAAATETESALRFSTARHEAITAAAERLQALGNDPAELASLDTRPATTLAPEASR
jgi:outer membrane protein TolC